MISGKGALQITWEHIPAKYCNGNLSYYTVSCEEMGIDGVIKKLSVPAKQTSALFKGLKTAQDYKIVIWGVNSFSDGVRSVEHITCE